MLREIGKFERAYLLRQRITTSSSAQVATHHLYAEALCQKHLISIYAFYRSLYKILHRTLTRTTNIMRKDTWGAVILHTACLEMGRVWHTQTGPLNWPHTYETGTKRSRFGHGSCFYLRSASKLSAYMTHKLTSCLDIRVQFQDCR
jgi:hypothetical protein